MTEDQKEDLQMPNPGQVSGINQEQASMPTPAAEAPMTGGEQAGGMSAQTMSEPMSGAPYGGMTDAASAAIQGTMPAGHTHNSGMPAAGMGGGMPYYSMPGAMPGVQSDAAGAGSCLNTNCKCKDKCKCNVCKQSTSQPAGNCSCECCS